MIDSPFLGLAGPTAVGKSEIALLLAEELHGEIVSVDSMQVYRGLDIGTAKPSSTERAAVPYHLVDIIDLTESFDAARFVEAARAAISNITARGRLPILCGGTGLYFKALLEGLGTAPPADPRVRSKLETIPLPDLLQELATADPETYRRIDRQNPRRVVRALEVIRLTGKPFSRQRAIWSERAQSHREAGRLWVLTRTPNDLRRRIEARVEEMFRRGLVAETKELLERGLGENRTASQALGYKQVIEFLNRARSLPETIDLVKTRTWQFAKRQLTWFSRQHAFTRITIQSGESAQPIAEQMISTFKATAGSKTASSC
jgi:tRNA dimethylallyltransferase